MREEHARCRSWGWKEERHRRRKGEPSRRWRREGELRRSRVRRRRMLARVRGQGQLEEAFSVLCGVSKISRLPWLARERGKRTNRENGGIDNVHHEHRLEESVR